MAQPGMRFQVGLHGTAVVAQLARIRLLTRVHTCVTLQVRVDFEFGTTLTALEWGIT